MSLSKSLRFEIFKRDSFTCQYCGRQTPTAVLEVDHIIPKAEGGTDDPNNLITACRDCNRGKGAVPLSIQRIKDTRKEEIICERERQEQIELYEAFIRQKRQEEEQTIEMFGEYWSFMCDDEYELSDREKASLRKFLRSLTYREIREAMEIAAQRIPKSRIHDRFRYFCGICHNKISDKTGDSARKVFKEVQRNFLSQSRGSGYHKEHILKNLCSQYPKESLMQAIDVAFSQRRGNYWKAFCWALSEITGDDIPY